MNVNPWHGLFRPPPCTECTHIDCVTTRRRIALEALGVSDEHRQRHTPDDAFGTLWARFEATKTSIVG